MVSIATVLNESSHKLVEVSGNNSKREAEILLEFSIKSQGKLFQLDHEISEDSYVFFKTLLEKRLKFQPISQIIGQRYFWKSKFLVTSDVLDPRPDTETLIEHTLSLGKFNRILDLGTGSGCILLSLLNEYKEAIGIGIDISKKALNVAKKNADLLNLKHRASFKLGNWCENIEGKFDLIVSNPPYISEYEMTNLSKDVLDWEPRIALTPEGDGLEAYKYILNGAKK
ncbi:peptide chain release factor N(5)-glutamine methyltransferase, partial [Amylibacter sp.]|nr:peptide chain release factor N(5)-glutamine methyltransferase [Amylibacter sp.]